MLRREVQSSTTGAATSQAEQNEWVHLQAVLMPLGESGRTNPLRVRLRSRGIPPAEPHHPQGQEEQNLTAESTGPQRGETIRATDLILVDLIPAGPIPVEALGPLSINPAPDIPLPAALPDLIHLPGRIQGAIPPVPVEDPTREDECPHREVPPDEAILHPVDPPGLTPKVGLLVQAESLIREDECPHRGVRPRGAAEAPPAPGPVALRLEVLGINNRLFI